MSYRFEIVSACSVIVTAAKAFPSNSLMLPTEQLALLRTCFQHSDRRVLAAVTWTVAACSWNSVSNAASMLQFKATALDAGILPTLHRMLESEEARSQTPAAILCWFIAVALPDWACADTISVGVTSKHSHRLSVRKQQIT